MKNAQKWLTDKISGEYRDKDGIIETILFACLIDYVEKELEGNIDEHIEANKVEAQNNSITESMLNDWCKFYIELKEKYYIVTKELPALEKARKEWQDKEEMVLNEDLLVFKSANPNNNLKVINFNIDQFRERIEKLTNETCEWIVKNRGFMWT
jgi:hypothetical protein